MRYDPDIWRSLVLQISTMSVFFEHSKSSLAFIMGTTVVSPHHSFRAMQASLSSSCYTTMFCRPVSYNGARCSKWFDNGSL